MRYSVTERELTPVLARFGIHGAIRGMAELLHRFDTEDSQEVRLIVRVDLADGRALVVKLLREENVTQEGLTAQGAFLSTCGPGAWTRRGATGQETRCACRWRWLAARCWSRWRTSCPGK